MHQKYKFMWGQKQSAMITQAMLSQLLFDFDLRGRFIDSGISEDLFILSDGVFSHYMPESSIKRLERNAKKMLKPKFANVLSRKINVHIKSFHGFARRTRASDYSKFSNAALLSVVKKYEAFLNLTFALFETSTPAGTSALVRGIQNIINRKVQNPKQRQRYFIWLCSADKADATMQERSDFIKLTKVKTVSAAQWRTYANQYPALFFNTYNEKQIFAFLRNKWLQEKRTNETKELELMRQTLKTNKARHKLVYTAIKSSKLKFLAKTLQETALDRYRLKHIWSGAEFLCLNLIQEIHKRSQAPFDDFIKTYTFADIYNLLSTGQPLTRATISNRRRALVYRYSNKHLELSTGSRAVKLQQKLLGKRQRTQRQNSKEILGTVANQGKVTAKVRVVAVKDLSSFSHDSKIFQKGEILVTTMTSPLMVPIVKKASGIITDEGGITSHAAVVAREFGIPCIVGTHGATSLLNTGDIVELDANKGIARKL